VKLAVKEGRDNLWGKTREAFRYIWNNYRDQADWFFKADDDTLLIINCIFRADSILYDSIANFSYVIVENLRYFLSGFNTTEARWFGHKFKHEKQEYMTGGPGEIYYILRAPPLIDVC